MITTVTCFNELSDYQYEFHKRILTGISEQELDWKPHPEGNSIRWIVGHLRWFEDWISDAIENKGRYLEDKGPTAYEFNDLKTLLNDFDKARARRVAIYEALSEDDTQKMINYFGAYEITVHALIRTHAGHMSGHNYQVRYIRGIYSRAHKTDKSVFDRW